MGRAYNTVLDCPNCEASFHVKAVDFDESGSPDWQPPEPAPCSDGACNTIMYDCCTTRCEFCNEPYCDEHLTKTDCGKLCAACAEEFTEQDDARAVIEQHFDAAAAN